MAEIADALPPGPDVRPFQSTDFVGGMVACPHCGQVLKCVAAEGPYLGFQPGFGLDRFWILTLSDGERCRMWEEGQGISLKVLS